MIDVSPWILLAVGVLGLLFLAWYSRRQRDETIADEYTLMRNREEARDARMDEFRTAYNLAYEELGEEPTVDQIFLTRDSLRSDDGKTAIEPSRHPSRHTK